MKIAEGVAWGWITVLLALYLWQFVGLLPAILGVLR